MIGTLPGGSFIKRNTYVIVATAKTSFHKNVKRNCAVEKLTHVVISTVKGMEITTQGITRAG